MTSQRVLVVGGGQSGLAAARATRDAGMEPVVLEAGEEPTGSWSKYYDTLTLFSPSDYSGFPGYGFPGLAGRYPTRDEVVDFLRGYAKWLSVEIRTASAVSEVVTDGERFVAHLADGTSVEADALIAATGSFANPYVPPVPGRERFAGEVLHVADYRSPLPYAGKRVVVVGAGNSAIQVGYELAAVADTTLAVRSPVQFVPQVRGGHDVHYWFDRLRLDRLPQAGAVPRPQRHPGPGHRRLPHGDRRRTSSTAADVLPVHRGRRRLGRRRERARRRGDLCDRLSTASALPRVDRRPQPGRHAAAPSGVGDLAPGTGVRRIGVPALVLLQHPARSAP